MNHYKKRTQEKLPVEIIIHVGAIVLSNEKEPKDMANAIIQPAKSIKIDTTKVAASTILSRKGKFNSKVKEIKTHQQDI